MKLRLKIIFAGIAGIVTIAVFTLIIHLRDIDIENQKLSFENQKISNEVQKLSNENQKLMIDLNNKNEILHNQKILQDNGVYKTKGSSSTNQFIDKKRSTKSSVFDEALALAEHASNPNVQHKQSTVEKSSLNIGQGNTEQIKKAFKGAEAHFKKNLNSSNKTN